jgi:hypothetical protein
MRARRKKRPAPPLPYWACLALWATVGPLGAGAAASGRWARAGLEAGLTIGGLWVFRDGFAIARFEGQYALTSALATGAVEPWRAWASVLLLCLAGGIWGSDFWRMRAWHGHKADPLLDTGYGDEPDPVSRAPRAG